jgi:hypothetical protein
MYNLLVTAEEGAWDRSFYQYDRSRFLEYTNNKVAIAFKSLTEKRITTLKSFPCVFAYEGTKNNVRIGFLTSIKERGRSILIEYKFHPEIHEIPFSSIESIAPLLDIRDWEMNRTHWAVKDEKLFERLQAASLIESYLIEAPEEHEDIDKLQESETHSFKVTTVQGFIEKVLSERGEEVKSDELETRSSRYRMCSLSK